MPLLHKPTTKSSTRTCHLPAEREREPREQPLSLREQRQRRQRQLPLSVVSSSFQKDPYR